MEQEAREQVRRDAEPSGEALSREWRGMGHRAVTEGVNLAYVEQMRRTLYAAADAYDALLDELEQAEREVARQIEQRIEDEPTAVRRQAERADLAETRLASVPALVEAALQVLDSTTSDEVHKEARRALVEALTVYEQSQGNSDG